MPQTRHFACLYCLARTHLRHRSLQICTKDDCFSGCRKIPQNAPYERDIHISTGHNRAAFPCAWRRMALHHVPVGVLSVAGGVKALYWRWKDTSPTGRDSACVVAAPAHLYFLCSCLAAHTSLRIIPTANNTATPSSNPRSKNCLFSRKQPPTHLYPATTVLSSGRQGGSGRREKRKEEERKEYIEQ